MITLRLTRWPRCSRAVPQGGSVCRTGWTDVITRNRLCSGPVRHLVEQGLGWGDSRVDFYRHSNSEDGELRLHAISRVYHVNVSRPTFIFWAEPQDNPALTSNS